jgi:ABC-2 type transport system ATP-binding protein
MEEAQYLCDEIAIMDYGKIIARGSPAELIRKHSPEMTVTLPKNHLTLGSDQLFLPVREVNGRIEIKTNDVDACLNILMTHGIDLSDLVITSPNLETVFLNLTGRQLRE